MQPEFTDPRTSLFSDVPSLLTQPARLAGDGRACKQSGGMLVQPCLLRTSLWQSGLSDLLQP